MSIEDRKIDVELKKGAAPGDFEGSQGFPPGPWAYIIYIACEEHQKRRLKKGDLGAWGAISILLPTPFFLCLNLPMSQPFVRDGCHLPGAYVTPGTKATAAGCAADMASGSNACTGSPIAGKFG